jgi:hypothetical protein
MPDASAQKGIDDLRRILTAARVPVKPSYTRAEVCRILGISARTFWYMVSGFEPGATAALDSFLLRRHRRVPYTALAEYIARNRGYERQCG